MRARDAKGDWAHAWDLCPLPPPGGSNGGSEGRLMGPGVASLPSVARGGYANWLVASLRDPAVYGESAAVVRELLRAPSGSLRLPGLE